MKKGLSFAILFAFTFLFTGCDTNTVGDASGYSIDYSNAETFESALNDGKTVKGKVVQFCVEEYAPDSILGINCHAGEHLNFLFEEELDVRAGDIIIVRITEEPSQIFLIGSWKVPCEFIELVTQNQEDETDKGTIEETQESDTDKEVTEETQESSKDDDSLSESENMAGAPDDWTNLLEKHYEEVKKQFENAGFTNIVCVAHEIDYNENNVFEGSVINIAIGENGEICTFEKGEQWDKDIKIRIDYRVKPTRPISEYEKAFVRDMSNYDLYYMFDTDTKTVVFFGTNDTYIEKGTYTGDFSSGVTITWNHGEWTEKFIHKSGASATLIDGSGWDWEYKVCDVEKAQKVLDSLAD